MCDVINFRSIISFKKFHSAHQLHKYFLFSELMREHSCFLFEDYITLIAQSCFLLYWPGSNIHFFKS